MVDGQMEYKKAEKRTLYKDMTDGDVANGTLLMATSLEARG